MIKAIIFDMDGVLIDAKEWHYLALNKALKLFGFEISRHDHLTTFDGLPTRKKLKMLTLQYGLPSCLHEFLNDLKQKYTIQIVHEKCAPVFAHQYALSRLRSQGYNIAVASNSVRASVELMMSKALLSQYLSFFLSNEDVSVSKPDPEIYNMAIRKLDLEPGEVVILEDNPHGIAAAKDSGAHVMEVSSIHDVSYSKIMSFIEKVEEKR